MIIKQIIKKMDIKPHRIKDIEIAEIVSDNIVIHNGEEALDLIGNIYYQGFDFIIIHQKNLIADFFDLKNGMAGDILQQFSNYRVRLTIVGDFTKFTSKSLNDFIYESNKGKLVNFVATIDEALNFK